MFSGPKFEILLGHGHRAGANPWPTQPIIVQILLTELFIGYSVNYTDMMLVFVDFTGIIVRLFGIRIFPDPRSSFRSPFLHSSRNIYDYAVALLKIMQKYYEWSYPAYVLNEIKDPVRTLKNAGLLGLRTIGLLNILANVAYFTIASP